MSKETLTDWQKSGKFLKDYARVLCKTEYDNNWLAHIWGLAYDTKGNLH